MKKIFIDLEMTPTTTLTKYQRALLRQEIIEIGAVMYDENGSCVSTFREYVRPAYTNHIMENIRQLTHITDEMVSDADPFEAVISRFLDWCGPDFRLYCWSDSDTAQLRTEALFKKYAKKEHLLSALVEWEDVQQIFGETAGFFRIQKLDVAADLCGITFKGQQHDALSDAIATAELYYEAKNGETIKAVRKCLADDSKEGSFGTSLGSLFSGLILSA